MALRIVADANIPHAADAFGALGPVRALPGREITHDALAQADVLLVRSVTRVDADLLDGTPVRFVGTATAGTDHVDTAALARMGVAFASAPGSNAASVADWVVAGLLAVAAGRGEALAGRTLGVVGVGEVGGRLAPRARALGLEVLACDPPQQKAGVPGLVDLATVLDRADIVTLHTPLTTPAESAWPTHGLIHDVGQLRPDAWLVNAARGPVVTAEAAGALAATRPVLLDVWPGEPSPTPSLIGAAALATPHVAGYAVDGKTAGTQMLADALRQWLGGDVPPWDASGALAPPEPLAAPPGAPSDVASETAWLDALARQAYDVRADDARFRAALLGPALDHAGRAAAFAGLRATYPPRREMSRHAVSGPVPAALRPAVEAGLGVAVVITPPPPP